MSRVNERLSITEELARVSMNDYMSDDTHNAILRVVCNNDVPYKKRQRELNEEAARRVAGITIPDKDRYIFSPLVIDKSPLLSLPVDILIKVYEYLSDFQQMLFYSNGTFIILRHMNRDIKPFVKRPAIYDKLRSISQAPEYLAMLSDMSKVNRYEMNNVAIETTASLVYSMPKQYYRDDAGAIRDIIDKILYIKRFTNYSVPIPIQLAIDIFLFVVEAISVGIYLRVDLWRSLPYITITDDVTYDIFEKNLDQFIWACKVIFDKDEQYLYDGIHSSYNLWFPLNIDNSEKAISYYNRIKEKLGNDTRKKIFIKAISSHQSSSYKLSRLIDRDKCDLFIV